MCSGFGPASSELGLPADLMWQLLPCWSSLGHFRIQVLEKTLLEIKSDPRLAQPGTWIEAVRVSHATVLVRAATGGGCTITGLMCRSCLVVSPRGLSPTGWTRRAAVLPWPGCGPKFG